MKACKACGEIKPLTEFYVNNAKADKLSFYCKPCTQLRVKAQLKRPPRNLAPPGFKRCATCKETLPHSDFHPSSETYDGRGMRCKACAYVKHNAWRLKNLDRAAATQKQWREEHPERVQDIGRKKLHGVPHGWYAETLAAQNGQCAICGTTEPGGKGTFHIDHCHDSKKIRGLLCHGCNLALGHIKDNPETARALAAYLIKAKQ